MKFGLPIFLFLIACASSAAVAQGRIVSASPESSPTLELHDGPDASRVVRKIKVEDAGLPLVVHAKEDGFYKVDIGGKFYWIRSVKVRVDRDTTASCGTLAQQSTGLSAGTPGAGKRACQ